MSRASDTTEDSIPPIHKRQSFDGGALFPGPVELPNAPMSPILQERSLSSILSPRTPNQEAAARNDAIGGGIKFSSQHDQNKVAVQERPRSSPGRARTPVRGFNTRQEKCVKERVQSPVVTEGPNHTRGGVPSYRMAERHARYPLFLLLVPVCRELFSFKPCRDSSLSKTIHHAF